MNRVIANPKMRKIADKIATYNSKQFKHIKTAPRKYKSILDARVVSPVDSDDKKYGKKTKVVVFKDDMCEERDLIGIEIDGKRFDKETIIKVMHEYSKHNEGNIDESIMGEQETLYIYDKD